MDSALRKKALSHRTGTVCSAIAAMISSSAFLLNDVDLKNLEERDQEIITGWIYAYRYYSPTSKDKIEFLLTGLKSENPRIREQACDIIGDNRISTLKAELYKLLADPIEYVAESAKYNHDTLQNA
jgi:hypothetical protein